jgi:excisionase family DNA binding protein
MQLIFFRRKFMINSGLMTIEDLAGYLKVTRRTIYEWLKHNRIPAIKLVGQWRFKKDKIDAWIETRSLH